MNPILINYFPGCLGQRVFGRIGVILIATLVVALTLGSTSCRTTYGLGQDIERTGDKIQEAASR